MIYLFKIGYSRSKKKYFYFFVNSYSKVEGLSLLPFSIPAVVLVLETNTLLSCNSLIIKQNTQVKKSVL